MDYSPTFRPEEPKKKTSFEEFLEEQQRERQKQQEDKDKSKEAQKEPKLKEGESGGESIFSFKKRIDGAAEKATKKLKEAEPEADLYDKKSIKKVVEGMAESEDLSQAEKDVISQKQKKITERASELLTSPTDARSDSDPLSLSPEQALSLAISEQIAEDEDSANQFDPTTQHLNSSEFEAGSDPQSKVRVAEVAGVIISQKLFEALSSEDEPARTSSQTSEGSDFARGDTAAGAETEGDLSSADRSNGSVAEAAPNTTVDTARQPSETGSKLKLASEAGGILGLKRMFGSAKPKHRSHIGGGGAASGSNNTQANINNRTVDSGGESGLLKHTIPDRVVEAVSTDALLRQIRRQKNNIRAEREFIPESEDLSSSAKRVAPIAESAKLNIARDVQIYSAKDSRDIVSAPQELERGWATEQKEAESRVEIFSEAFVGESLVRDDENSMVVFDRSSEQLVIDANAEGGAAPLIMYNRGQTHLADTINPDPQNLESHFTIKQFEKYLEVVTLDTKPTNSKELKKKVAKKLGRPLTLTEQKNVDNFWMKREAKLKASQPDILTGVDQRRRGPEFINDKPDGNDAGPQGNSSGDRAGDISSSRQNDGVFSSGPAKKGSTTASNSLRPAVAKFNSPGANLALAIFAIAALAFAIIYAIIIMI